MPRILMPQPRYRHQPEWRKCAACRARVDVTLVPPAFRISRRSHDAVARSSAAGIDPHCPSSRIAFANARLCAAAVVTARACKGESD